MGKDPKKDPKKPHPVKPNKKHGTRVQVQKCGACGGSGTVMDFVSGNPRPCSACRGSGRA